MGFRVALKLDMHTDADAQGYSCYTFPEGPFLCVFRSFQFKIMTNALNWHFVCSAFRFPFSLSDGEVGCRF